MFRDYFADPARWSREELGRGWPQWAERVPPRRVDRLAARAGATPAPFADPRRSAGQRIPVRSAELEGAPEPASGPPSMPANNAAEESAGLVRGAVEAHAPDTEAREPDAEAEPDPAPAASAGETDKDRLREALRELEEAKRRVLRDAEREREQVRAQLVADLLPVLDNLDRTIAAAGSAEQALLDGVELVRSQFEQVLASYGLERIDAQGERFDPAVHEAIGVAEVTSPDDDGRVVEQWQAGYRFGDRVLRAAKVRVGKLTLAPGTERAPAS